MLIGHVAISILEERYLGTDLGPTLLGGLFPDMLDKTLCQVLHVTPSGRMWGHTLLGLGITSLLARAVVGKRAARSWTLGYIGHLLADTGGHLPLWYPFKAYDFEPSPDLTEIFRHFFDNRSEVAIEIGLFALALLALPTTFGVRRSQGPEILVD